MKHESIATQTARPVFNVKEALMAREYLGCPGCTGVCKELLDLMVMQEGIIAHRVAS